MKVPRLWTGCGDCMRQEGVGGDSFNNNTNSVLSRRLIQDEDVVGIVSGSLLIKINKDHLRTLLSK